MWFPIVAFRDLENSRRAGLASADHLPIAALESSLEVPDI